MPELLLFVVLTDGGLEEVLAEAEEAVVYAD